MKTFKSGFVAVVGRPNAGKSTLINALVGERIAAVSPKAQTTRKRIRAICNLESAQIIFVDTPGIHRAPEGKIFNASIVEEAIEGINEVDTVVYLIDTSRELPEKDDLADENLIIEALARTTNKNILLFVNKVDLTSKVDPKRIEAIAAKIGAKVVLRGSALKPPSELVSAILEHLPEHPPYYDTDLLTSHSTREVVAELIQEQLFLFLGEEIPYECAVEVEKYKEPKGKKKKPEIDAVIHVARKSIKGMVIGKEARKIKEISQAARARVEEFLHMPVVLRLRAKESIGWTKNKQTLERLGYTQK